MTRRNTTQALSLLGILILASLLMGCGTTLVPFTHELRSQHQLTDDDVKHLQFYVSREVTLRRDATHVGRQIEGGRLKLLRGKQVQEIVVRDATPGVALAVGPDALEVSFQEGSSLIFSLRGSGSPSYQQPLKQERGPYATAPDAFPGEGSPPERAMPDDSFFGNYFLQTQSDDHQVSFQGQLWEAVDESFSAHLMIDAEALEDVIETHEVLGGRKIVSRKGALPVILF